MANHNRHVTYSQPDAGDRPGPDFDATGHLVAARLEELGVPLDGDFHLCGPPRFMRELGAGLAARGVASTRIRSEIFGGSEPSAPGVVGGAARAPHAPAGAPGAGARVWFARSGIAASWDPAAYQSLLELAESCDVPVRWSCRTGVCHSCESGLVSGSVGYEPEPLDGPADGNLLICCARPAGDVVIDI